MIKTKKKKEEFKKIIKLLENIKETKEKEDKQKIIAPNFNFNEPIKKDNNNQFTKKIVMEMVVILQC